jgi:hypothetical protein
MKRMRGMPVENVFEMLKKFALGMIETGIEEHQNEITRLEKQHILVLRLFADYAKNEAKRAKAIKDWQKKNRKAGKGNQFSVFPVGSGASGAMRAS